MLSDFYFNKREDGQLEVLDVQQRITSLGRFITSKFAILENGMQQYFRGLAKDKQEKILNTKLLEVRIFEEHDKKIVYARQTQEAKEKGISNCPLYALGNGNNKNRIWQLKEMDADHVMAWSKGGATDINNCQMLCKTHNRAKGNK